MTPDTLLAELERRGVRLQADGRQVRCRGPQGALTPELQEAIRKHKAAILAIMNQDNVVSDGPSSRVTPIGDEALRFCVHRRIEEQAADSPDLVAVVFESQKLTYRELNARANRLAHHLHSLGVGPDVLVGIHMERSIEMVVGILGVLKAGGAYVPLDPTYPARRLAVLLADTQPPVLLTQEHLADSLPPHPGRVLCLDADPAEIAGRPVDNPTRITRPEHLAYVIHTSGSTGKPKGAMNTHRGLCNRLLWMQDAYRLTPEDRVLQKTPFSFDVSVWEFLWPLMTGARLVVARPDGHRDPAYLARLIEEQEITTLHFVPSMLELFLQEADPQRCRSLRRVICSGEALSYDLQERFFSRLDAELHNLYGPTEAAIDVTFWACRRSDPRKIVPIGRPIANTRIYLLDPNLEPVPVGIPGEIYIGGAGLARGYLNQPRLTAEAFVPNPFDAAPDSTLYKSGDLARWLEDGNIEFLGRIDHQVKIRGMRIELGEIEAALADHPSVRQALVMMRDDAPGDRRLVAYVVPDGQDAPTISELRRHVAGRLPEYMVPAAFVFMDAIPLLPNGKADRRALPAPETTRPALEKAYLAPRTPLERYLAEIWQDVLGLDKVGVHDDFFDLGGNSLQGARIVYKLEEMLGEYVYIVALFDAPTIAALAAHLARDLTEPVRKAFGDESLDGVDAHAQEVGPTVTAADVSALRASVKSYLQPPLTEPSTEPKNPSAVFILSPPRCGSTLLRVMLAGHPRLFAPPELQLLGFSTLARRRDAFSRRDRYWLNGAIRAVMEAKNCSVDQAERFIAECQQQNLSTKRFYALLQESIDGRILVDKTPTYPLDPETLKHAEAIFAGARYIHLTRHPSAMIASFEEARLHALLRPFFEPVPDVPPRRLAELIWIISHQNIETFLEDIPAQRKFRVRFETLLSDPRDVMTQIARFLALPFDESMIQPYRESSKRMTDSVDRLSRMLGDVKFHQHRAIEPHVADRWKTEIRNRSLGDLTIELAESQGYARRDLAASSGYMSVEQLSARAVLDPGIEPKTAPAQTVTAPGSIFLTGATGFLGAFLLRELLDRTPADLHCLVRAGSEKEGFDKLQSGLERYALWDETFSARIIPVPGDLSRPLLGIRPGKFETLSRTVDTIFHNGALVNFLYPYSALKGPNVFGTQEVLRLACRGTVKPVHYVSTLSVFASSDSAGAEHTFDEKSRLDDVDGLYGGYAQTKWVAEKLVTEARSRGLPVTIHRPGRITGHSRTGLHNADDWLHHVLHASLRVGVVPDVDMTVDMAPVDYVSRAIVELSSRKGSVGNAFHLANPRPAPWSRVVQWIQAFGYAVRRVALEEWIDEMRTAAQSASAPTLAPLTGLLGDQSIMARLTRSSRRPRFDCQHTQGALSKAGISCPPVDAELVHTYLSYFVRSGSLDQQPSSGKPGRSDARRDAKAGRPRAPTAREQAESTADRS